MRGDPFPRLLQRWLEDILKDTFDPAAFMRFAGMATGTTAFDPYRILGLERSASDEEIKKRYHEMLRHLHPDTAGIKGTEALLHMVIAAYEMVKQERGWT